MRVLFFVGLTNTFRERRQGLGLLAESWEGSLSGRRQIDLPLASVLVRVRRVRLATHFDDVFAHSTLLLFILTFQSDDLFDL